MGRENRLTCGRAALSVVLMAWIPVASGCGNLLGIDDGIPFPTDASARDTAPGEDAAVAETSQDVALADEDVTNNRGDTGSGEDTSPPDAAEEADAPGEAAAPDAPSGACSPD